MFLGRFSLKKNRRITSSGNLNLGNRSIDKGMASIQCEENKERINLIRIKNNSTKIKEESSSKL